MGHVFTVIAPGAMGSAVARRLAEHGAEVRTTLAGRSASSRARAAAAGMRPVEDETELVDGVDAVLAILPPGEARGLAQRLAPLLAAARRKPLYLDCNAVSPATMAAISALLASTGATILDGGIIGGPPRPGAEGPHIYVSGEAAPSARLLREYGLDIRILDGPLGAASALKMSYAGLTKGLTAIGAAMFLGAAASGADAALVAELAESQPEMLAMLRHNLPPMYAKAYRWVAEMREIAAFLGPDVAGAQIYEGAARLYDQLAAAHAAPAADGAIARLDGVLAQARRRPDRP